MLAHIGSVDHDLIAVAVGGVEGDVVEDTLHHGREPPRADILDIGVHLDRDVGDRVDRIVGEVELDALRLHQSHVLLDQARLGLGEDAAEIVARQRAQLDADREPAL